MIDKTDPEIQKYVQEELQKQKINMPAKLLDEDLENKIKQLEGDKNPPKEDKND